MNVALVQELAPDGLTCATFKEHIIGHNDGSAAMNLEKRLYVLKKVELLVAGGCPKVIAVIGEALFALLAFIIDDGNARFLAERRVGKHHLVVG